MTTPPHRRPTLKVRLLPAPTPTKDGDPVSGLELSWADWERTCLIIIDEDKASDKIRVRMIGSASGRLIGLPPLGVAVFSVREGAQLGLRRIEVRVLPT
jgi:hypothetical protein